VAELTRKMIGTGLLSLSITNGMGSQRRQDILNVTEGFMK